MFCITPDTDDPFFNLAIEETLLKNSRDEYLLLYINSPSLVIGKHQSVHREVETRFITENNIPVIRRISGGGTVYHDHGNLNFTFIRQSEPGRQVDFMKHTLPVINFLSSAGVEAKLEGKNDLKVDGLKISGNAEHVHRNRVLHHGTLLFSTSLEMMRASLRKDTSCYLTRAVASNPSSVTNLKDRLKQYRNISEFRSAVLNYFLKEVPYCHHYDLTQKEIEEAGSLADSKYKSWQWNWAYGPEYHFSRQFGYSGKMISCKMFVREGIICECALDGSSELNRISAKLIGCRHMVNDLLDVFNKEDFPSSDVGIFNFF